MTKPCSSYDQIHIGYRVGHLEVIKLHNRHWRGNSWVCRCDCGKEVILYSSHLLGSKKRRANKSCGCSEYAHNGKVVENLRLYSIWHGMLKRCYNPKATEYKRYGGIGVRVAECWRFSFETFRTWALKNGYDDHLTIDRIESSKGYEPSNCRWVDYYIQNQNKGVLRNNKTGVKGVCKQGNGYRSYIQRNDIYKNLVFFKTVEEAREARVNAEIHFSIYGTIEDL